MKKIVRFFVGVKKEMKKVKWPSKKEMITYSTATIVFILIFGLFFTGLDFIISGLKMVVK
mgnify:CR=1 FL=1